MALAAVLLWPACAATAVPFVPDFSAGPVVFDFEDGLQGWTAGSVERVATDVLGGDWALFADGLMFSELEVGGVVFAINENVITIEMDLTEVAWLELDQLYLGEASSGTDFVGELVLIPITPSISISALLTLSDPDPLANPGRRRLDLRDRNGVDTLRLIWACFKCPEFDAPLPGEPLAASGYIDNITLYSIPEPATALLLACGLVGLGVRRRLQ